MVCGRWMVSWGVFMCGVLMPKEPMLLGVNTWQPFSRATSRTFHKPSMPMRQASRGFDSATTLSSAARL